MTALATVMTVSCCGGTGSPNAAAVGVKPTFGVFSGRLTLAGEVAAKGTFVDRLTARHQKCHAYAHGLVGGTREFAAPTPDGSTSVEGHTVMYTAGLAGTTPNTAFRGPGTYSEPAAVVYDLVVDNAGFLPGDSARTTLTVSADGSGSLFITDLLDVSTNALESGTARWTCSD